MATAVCILNLAPQPLNTGKRGSSLCHMGLSKARTRLWRSRFHQTTEIEVGKGQFLKQNVELLAENRDQCATHLEPSIHARHSLPTISQALSAPWPSSFLIDPPLMSGKAFSRPLRMQNTDGEKCLLPVQTPASGPWLPASAEQGSLRPSSCPRHRLPCQSLPTFISSFDLSTQPLGETRHASCQTKCLPECSPWAPSTTHSTTFALSHLVRHVVSALILAWGCRAEDLSVQCSHVVKQPAEPQHRAEHQSA